MPIFDYSCHACQRLTERIVPYDRCYEQRCDFCDGPLERGTVHAANCHVPVVTGARLWNGQKIPGRFGKPNKKKRRQSL